MKRYLKGGLTALFILFVLFGGMTLHTIIQSQHYSRLVNYVGIVRGASQRLIKLELEGQPSDSLIEYLDGILDELTTGKGEYGLPLPKDGAYRQSLSGLCQMWGEMKEQIFSFRSGDGGEALLSLSETYFDKANDTVCAADFHGAPDPQSVGGMRADARHHAADLAVYPVGVF